MKLVNACAKLSSNFKDFSELIVDAATNLAQAKEAWVNLLAL